ncbi:hypothetical protein AC578_10874 [Pseudocercospora eumusae]|uniref:Uncharacterized protein n=1 Tax=Pseudocercospora eumusae TaxID=321146 RepID=A0A139H8X7_9PEZI|nr:hypothetical protein AC578_10874 [Pseudocercospora eumusae]
MATRTRPQTKSSSKQVAVQQQQQQSGSQKKNIKTHVVESLNPFNVGVFCACSTLVGGALSIYMTNYWFGKKATEKANQDKKDLADHRNVCMSDSHSNDSREKSSSSRSRSSRSSSCSSYDRDYYYDDRRRRDYDRRRDYEERENYSRRR